MREYGANHIPVDESSKPRRCNALLSTGERCDFIASVHFDIRSSEVDTMGRRPHMQDPVWQPFCEKHGSRLVDAILAQAGLPAGNIPEVLDAARAHQKTVANRRKYTNPITGFVYFVRRDDFIKIGTSIQPTKRIRDLEHAAGRKFDSTLVVRGGQAKEKRYHATFRHLRTMGEWFRADPELLDFMATLKDVRTDSTP